MQTKLTLRLEEQLIERAKAHAKKRGKSVSQMWPTISRCWTGTTDRRH